jgi:hypothetical protein
MIAMLVAGSALLHGVVPDPVAVWGLTRMSGGTDRYWDIDGLMPGQSKEVLL